jgi:glycosyltransferase involved in cell wall biosynthesis
MKIAVLAVRTLRGTGYSTRIVSMLKSYSALGHEVDFFHYRFTHEAELPNAYQTGIRRYVQVPLEGMRLRRHLSTTPPLASLCLQAHQRHLREVEQYDVVQAETSATWAAASRMRAQRKVVVLHDDDAVRLSQISRMSVHMSEKLLSAVDAWKYSRWQRTVLESANRIWFVSRPEHDRLAFDSIENKSAVVPNGAADEFWAVPPKPRGEGHVFFAGPGFYEPNVHGLTWFIHEVWPVVREAVPTAELRVAGVGWEGMTPTPDVSFLGWCPSLSGEYARASVCIAPVFAGGGTKIKVIESMAAARPVVTTVNAVDGIPRSTGVRVARDARGFAAGVIAYLTDSAAARSAGIANRTAVDGLRWSKVWESADRDLRRLFKPDR